MFNNSNTNNCGGGGGGSSGINSDQSNFNNKNKRIERNYRDAIDGNRNADEDDIGVDEEIPKENKKLLLDKNSNRELFTMDSLNRNSLTGNWWVVISDGTQSYLNFFFSKMFYFWVECFGFFFEFTFLFACR